MADQDIRIDITRETAPLPLGDFNLPLILAQSGDDVVEDYRTYPSLTALEEDYDDSSSPRIVNWARYMFRTGAGEVSVYNLDRGTEPAVGDLSDALSDIENEEFFYVTSTSRDASDPDEPQGAEGDRDDVSEWCQDNDRKFITSNNVGQDPADQATAIESLNRDQTHWLAFETRDGEDVEQSNIDFPVDAALAGRLSANFPGSINFKFQELADIPAADYSATEINDIEDAGGSVYTSKKSIEQTSAALSTDGETFSDIPIIELWLKENLISRIIRLLVDEDRVPYTNTGIEQIESRIVASLEEGVEEGLVVDDYDVRSPDADEISSAERADRIAGDFEFDARLQGAINEVEISGTITA